VCQKTYYSENAYQNHLLSQKHKANELASAKRPNDETTSVVSSTFSLGEPVPVRRASIDSAAEEEFTQVVESLQRSGEAPQRPSPVKRPSNPQAGAKAPNGADSTSEDTKVDEDSDATTPAQKDFDIQARLKSCIFCNYSSPTLPLNASHMERFHGMFIPEKDYLVDLEGLVGYLHRKVQEYHQCLYCDKMKSTAFGAQTHMRDKGHCKIPFESEEEQLEIGNYYDFRATYSDSETSEDEDEEDEEERQSSSKSKKLGARRASGTVGGGNEDDEDGEGWETDSSASSLDSADLTAVPAEGHLHQFERLGKHPHHSRRDPRNRHQADGWHSHAHKHTHAVFYDDYEMHLPSGRSVGHRSLNKYYRQNLNSYPTADERLERQAIEGPDADSQNNNRSVISRDSAGMTGVSLQKRREVRQVEDRARKLEDFHAKRNDYKYGKKLNNQKSYYYRYQRGG
jgi:pre-60S factor REI1